MTDNFLLRQALAVDDRTFAVLAECWYDAASGEWRGGLMYLPLDRSQPHPLCTGPLRHSKRRDALLDRLRRVTAREMVRALRVLLPAQAPRARAG